MTLEKRIIKINKQFAIYILVGLLSNISAISGASISFRILKLDYLISSIVGILLGLIISYFLNVKETFKAKFSSQNFIFYLCSYLILIGIGIFLVHIFYVRMGLIYEFSVLFSSIIGALFGFFLNKFLVFKNV